MSQVDQVRTMATATKVQINKYNGEQIASFPVNFDTDGEGQDSGDFKTKFDLTSNLNGRLDAELVMYGDFLSRYCQYVSEKRYPFRSQ